MEIFASKKGSETTDIVSRVKLSTNEAVLNLSKWFNRDNILMGEALKDTKPGYEFFICGLSPKTRQKRKFHNDDQAPDSNVTLFHSRKKADSHCKGVSSQVTAQGCNALLLIHCRGGGICKCLLVH